MKLLAPLKKFILFGLATVDDFSILSGARFVFLLRLLARHSQQRVISTCRHRRAPRHSSPQCIRYRLMYLQEPIPIVILGYDLRLWDFDCQISMSFTRTALHSYRATHQYAKRPTYLLLNFHTCYYLFLSNWFQITC